MGIALVVVIIRYSFANIFSKFFNLTYPFSFLFFSSLLLDAFKEVKGLKTEEIFSEPLIFTEFHKQPGGIATYLGVADAATIQDVLDAKLEEYNESNTIMELVLFRDAIAHVCRIARIIAKPRGNALLIGVGGSGKQSLSRLATFICGYEVRQLSVSSRYGVEDFKEELRQMYITAGQKGQGVRSKSNS